VRDAVGGRAPAARELVDTVPAKVSQATAEERTVAAQQGVNHSHTIHMPPWAGVRRGDELRGDGQTFKVIATLRPSSLVSYLRANAELREEAPGAF
jgi:hypothetical protein